VDAESLILVFAGGIKTVSPEALADLSFGGASCTGV